MKELLLVVVELIVDVCSTTGVPLDPEFCIKGVRGMLGEMTKNPGRFAGRRVLFLHTGTIISLPSQCHSIVMYNSL